jgi:hypothetical protein
MDPDRLHERRHVAVVRAREVGGDDALREVVVDHLAPPPLSAHAVEGPEHAPHGLSRLGRAPLAGALAGEQVLHGRDVALRAERTADAWVRGEHALEAPDRIENPGLEQGRLAAVDRDVEHEHVGPRQELLDPRRRAPELAPLREALDPAVLHAQPRDSRAEDRDRRAEDPQRPNGPSDGGRDGAPDERPLPARGSGRALDPRGAEEREARRDGEERVEPAEGDAERREAAEGLDGLDRRGREREEAERGRGGGERHGAGQHGERAVGGRRGAAGGLAGELALDLPEDVDLVGEPGRGQDHREDGRREMHRHAAPAHRAEHEDETRPHLGERDRDTPGAAAARIDHERRDGDRERDEAREVGQDVASEQGLGGGRAHHEGALALARMALRQGPDPPVERGAVGSAGLSLGRRRADEDRSRAGVVCHERALEQADLRYVRAQLVELGGGLGKGLEEAAEAERPHLDARPRLGREAHHVPCPCGLAGAALPVRPCGAVPLRRAGR